MLGKRICILRCQKGLTQAELADLLYISASALGMYEQERRQPALALIVLMAQIFGVSVDYLLTGRPITSNDLETCTQALRYLCNKFQADLCSLFSDDLSPKDVDLLVMALLSSEVIES